MRFFGSGKRAAYNAAWAEFRAAGQQLLAVPESLLSDADVQQVRTAALVCPVCPTIRGYFDGPEIAGESVPTHDEEFPQSAAPRDVMWHHALMILNGIVSCIGSRAYGGLWQRTSDSEITLAVWVEYPASRLLLMPKLSLGADDISLNISHMVLWRQGWMTEHGDDDFGWADLSTNYLVHLAEGGTYWEVMASWKKGERLWQKSWFGVGFDQSVGQEVALSERFNTFYHFKVGERWFRPGSPQGNDFRVARQTIVELARQWGEFGRRQRTHPQRPPDARLHDAVRQKEE